MPRQSADMRTTRPGDSVSGRLPDAERTAQPPRRLSCGLPQAVAGEELKNKGQEGVKGKKKAAKRQEIDEEDDNLAEDDDLLNMGGDNVPGMD